MKFASVAAVVGACLLATTLTAEAKRRSGGRRARGTGKKYKRCNKFFKNKVSKIVDSAVLDCEKKWIRPLSFGPFVRRCHFKDDRWYSADDDYYLTDNGIGSNNYIDFCCEEEGAENGEIVVCNQGNENGVNIFNFKRNGFLYPEAPSDFSEELAMGLAGGIQQYKDFVSAFLTTVSADATEVVAAVCGLAGSGGEKVIAYGTAEDLFPFFYGDNVPTKYVSNGVKYFYSEEKAFVGFSSPKDGLHSHSPSFEANGNSPRLRISMDFGTGKGFCGGKEVNDNYSFQVAYFHDADDLPSFITEKFYGYF
jgi:hypothetical protein